MNYIWNNKREWMCQYIYLKYTTIYFVSAASKVSNCKYPAGMVNTLCSGIVLKISGEY